MANGIDDLMSIRTTGGTQNVPPRPPMNPMQGGLASMGAGQPTMPPVVEEQRAMPPMGGQEMPSEQPQEPVSIEQDSAALAEAVVGRAQGDIGAAVAILDTAKAMLMQGGQEEPMMMAGGGALKPVPEGNKGLGKLPEDVRNKMGYMNMGGPLYAEDGMPLTDSETMKQMIMNSLRENPVLNSEGAYNITSPMGTNVRTAVSQLSNDVLGRDVSDNRTQEAANAAIAYQMSLR